MESIKLMVEEHRNIKRMLTLIRKMCYLVLKDQPIDYDDFYKVIDFVRVYADDHHHGKEEALLFDRMVKEQGPVADKLVRHGMLVEHNTGRMHMQDLEDALKRIKNQDEEAKLDLIASAISYTHLMYRHIDKEDNAVYTYAENHLSKETWEELEEACHKFEVEAEKNQVQARYIELIQEMEEKYNI